MTASPPVFVVADDATLRQQLVQQCRGFAEARAFASVEDALGFFSTHLPDGPIVDALSRRSESLRLMRGLQARGVTDAVQQVVREDGRIVGLQSVDLASVCTGGLWECAEAVQQVVERPVATAGTPELQELRRRAANLTKREAEVMHRVVDGLMNKQVAAELCLSSKTIEVHRAHVMDKMRADSFAALVRMAVKLEEAEASQPHAQPVAAPAEAPRATIVPREPATRPAAAKPRPKPTKTDVA